MRVNVTSNLRLVQISFLIIEDGIMLVHHRSIEEKYFPYSPPDEIPYVFRLIVPGIL